MSIMKEIDLLVKKAQLEQLKPIDYFSGMQSYDPELDQILAQQRTEMQRDDNQRRQFINLSQNRQMVPAPSRRLIRGSGWTGREVRRGSFAPIDTVSRSQIKPRYATNVAMPGIDGKGRFLVGGGKLDVGADGKPKASVGGVPVVKWEDLPSTKMMLDASNPKVNTPAVRRQKMMAYMPNAFRSRTSKPVSRQTGVASSPSQKFDFRGEAIKLLRSYGADASRSKGGYSTDIGRSMISQWKDMQANPQKYDEARQRQILDQWRSNIAQMRAGSSQHDANSQSIASTPRKQQPVA